jgi:hypothetical protein
MVGRQAAKADVERKGVWRSELLAVIALLVFVGIVVGIDVSLRPTLRGGGLLIAGLVLAVVPAILWLAFFYFQDRLEPEPIGHVARLFVIGAALGGAFALPLLNQGLHVQDWLYRDTLSMVLGSLLIGVVEIFSIYAAVRYFIFDSPEFDERIDGVVYGTAAGLGLATVSNLQFILSSGGAALGPGEVYVAEVALAQAAFGGLMGYFLGRAKLEREPAWWLAAGFLLTAILDAAFNLLRGQLEDGSFAFGAASQLPSLTGLVLAGGLAIVLTLVVSVLIGRDLGRARSGQAEPAAADASVGDRQANLIVMAAFLVLLAVGLVGWNSATNATTAFAQEGIRGSYPADFTPITADGELLRVGDPLGDGTIFSVRAIPLGDGQDAGSIATQLGGERGSESAFYRVTEQEPAQLAGRTALRQRFAYVDEGGLTQTTPRVVEGIDYIVVEGGRALVVSMLAGPDLATSEAQFEQFISSLSF